MWPLVRLSNPVGAWVTACIMASGTVIRAGTIVSVNSLSSFIGSPLLSGVEGGLARTETGERGQAGVAVRPISNPVGTPRMWSPTRLHTPGALQPPAGAL